MRRSVGILSVAPASLDHDLDSGPRRAQVFDVLHHRLYVGMLHRDHFFKAGIRSESACLPTETDGQNEEQDEQAATMPEKHILQARNFLTPVPGLQLGLIHC